MIRITRNLKLSRRATIYCCLALFITSGLFTTRMLMQSNGGTYDLMSGQSEGLQSNIFSIGWKSPQESSEDVWLPPSSLSPKAFILDRWISEGEYKDRHSPEELLFDIVYTWVNGTEKRYGAIREFYEQQSPMFKPKEHRTYTVSPSRRNDKRFRDNGELRYSVRSVEAHLGPQVNKIWVLTTDFPLDLQASVSLKKNLNPNTSPSTEWREGQVPQWLNLSWIDDSTGQKRIEMVHHSQIFNDAQNALPTFNSLAIESQIMNIDRLSDKIIYFNDDLFVGSDLSTADLWTPMYGYVFHAETHLVVKPDWHPSQNDWNGEWYALEYTNYLLSKKFGNRYRTYISHIMHPLSASILREIAREWPEEFHNTSLHRFRGEGPDVHTSFLFTHYVMEKHRETLLKSFFLWRMDENLDGQFDWLERRKILDIIGDGNVGAADRETLKEYQAELKEAGIGYTHRTTYSWSAMDGYAFHTKSPLEASRDGKPVFYETLQSPVGVRTCQIEVDKCFGEEFSNEHVSILDATEVFTRAAFEHYECGDCLIHLLVGKSGKKGLSAFLPSESAIVSYDTFQDITKANNNEKNVNTVNNTYQKISLRSYATSLLSRYAYSLGQMPYAFKSLRFPTQTINSLNELRATKPDVFCLNDDMDTASDDSIRVVRRYLREFLEGLFPNVGEYELPDNDSITSWFWRKR